MRGELERFLSELETESRQAHRFDRSQKNLTYRTWNAMHSRCYYTKDKRWDYYGGKGIQVCLRWHRSNLDGFKNFVSDLGPRLPGLTIDRLNSDWGYMPSNCRWATIQQQANNKPKKYKNMSMHDDRNQKKEKAVTDEGKAPRTGFHALECQREIRALDKTLLALKALTEWGRTYTSPLDPNSPHDLLIAAVEAINEAEVA